MPEVYDIMMKTGITETVIGVLGQISSFMKGLHGETIALEGSMNRLTRGVRDFGLIAGTIATGAGIETRPPHVRACRQGRPSA